MILPSLVLPSIMFISAAFGQSEARLPEATVDERISAAFGVAHRSRQSAALKAALWVRFKGRLLSAGVCVAELEPRLGCLGTGNGRAISVRTTAVPARESEGDSAAPAGGRQLDGKWEGSDFVLRVDSSRAQANVNTSEPFQWQRFIVRRVLDSRIDFAIGAEVFSAEVRSNELTLSSTSFRGERVLKRQEPL
jgi:hypothetical protein